MGDTIAIYKENTLIESLIFGKNSNHSPNEVFLTLEVDAKDHPSGTMLKTTTISIPQVSHTYGMVLQKPKWCWGCETGMNEKGVSIGCETVATRATPVSNPDGLIGNDICRLVLERCDTAKAGSDLIIELFESYGHCPWTEGSLDPKAKRDYSYLIADSDNIYVVETAGKHWVRKRVSKEERLYEITNMLTMSDDYDDCSESVKKQEREGYKVLWKKTFGRYLKASFDGAPVRRYGFTDSVISDLEGRAMKVSKYAVFGFKSIRHGDGVGVTVSTFKYALRRHMKQNMDRPSQPCMHFGDTKKSLATVASFISVPGMNMVSTTASSTPCRSIFKPIYLGGTTPFFKEGQETEAERYWIIREIVARSSFTGFIDKARFKSGIREIEAAYDAKTALMREGTFEELSDFNELVWEYDLKYYEQNFNRSGKTVEHLKPMISTVFFKRLWRPVNKKLLEMAYEIGGIL